MTPNQLGDFYEGVTWTALQRIYGERVTYWGRKRKDAFTHTCGTLCEWRASCKKHQASSGLIYTVPDFIVDDPDGPIVFHVCHWNSKETSHAKFWRSIAELYELKCFVPNVRCVNLVFEATHRDGKYSSPGWYSEFLRVFHNVFDKTVFFASTNLSSDANQLAHLDVVSATSVRDAISDDPTSFSTPGQLARAIRTATHPKPEFSRELAKMWKWEREYCSRLPDFRHFSHFGERLRNAMLIVVLISMAFDIEIGDILQGLDDLAQSKLKSKPAIRLLQIVDLPVSNRDGLFQFCAEKAAGAYGIVRYQLHPDLDWLVRSIQQESLGVDKELLTFGIQRTLEKFTASPQVLESISAVKQFLGSKDSKDFSQWTSKDWYREYVAVGVDSEYNDIGEFLLSGTGRGTYEIVSRINRIVPRAAFSRNDIRAFYSNKRSDRAIQRHKELIDAIISAFKGEFDWAAAITAYILRKTGRIVGPQSAINPLEELLLAILDGVEFASNYSVSGAVLSVSTLASSFSDGEELGSWRVTTSLNRSEEVIPIFLSGMKEPADCGHKTREFTGHLRMARYTSDGSGISRVSSPTRGIAVLEGGYGEAEKRAFHLAGFQVVSMATICETLRRLGIAK